MKRFINGSPLVLLVVAMLLMGSVVSIFSGHSQRAGQ